MRARPMLLAVLLTGALIGAGCAAPTVAPGPSGSPATGAGSSATSNAPVPTGGSAPTGAPSTASSAPSSRQSAITVVAPPTGASSGDDAVVTTTVTVTPSRTSADTVTSRSTPAPRSTPHRSTATSPTTRSSPTGPPAGHGSLAGKVVVVDPGHNGANHLHPEIINKQVPAGFGEYKNCNTTGTETNDGYPEYRFNWQVGLALRDALQAKGITVVMTRDSDDGIGPCVNKRAAIGNDAHADAVVSIHGDGESADIKGFYVMTASRPPAGQAMAARSDELAAAIRDGLAGANFPASNALGQDGLWSRSDLAGLNLSLRPTVMIECGNMRNAAEAALMSSADGQQRYAAGIAAGVIAYLGG